MPNNFLFFYILYAYFVSHMKEISELHPFSLSVKTKVKNVSTLAKEVAFGIACLSNGDKLAIFGSKLTEN